MSIFSLNFPFKLFFFSFLFILFFWRNVCWSTLVPQKLPCFGKVVITCLHSGIILFAKRSVLNSWQYFEYVALWCSGYHYYKISFNKIWSHVLRRFKSSSRHFKNWRWWGSLTIVLAGNKATRLSLVNHTKKTFHYHQYHLRR